MDPALYSYTAFVQHRNAELAVREKEDQRTAEDVLKRLLTYMRTEAADIPVENNTYYVPLTFGWDELSHGVRDKLVSQLTSLGWGFHGIAGGRILLREFVKG